MPVELSAHDVAIWQTVRINDLIDAGQFAQVPVLPTFFRPAFDAHERVVAAGPFTLYNYRSLGDGSYTVDNSMFMASGRIGVAMTLGAAIGRAHGNARRRREAAAAAVPRWLPIESGTVFVSDWGFYMQCVSGLLNWRWGAIDGMWLIDLRRVLFTGSSVNGRIQWVLESDWSELVFTLWARAVHPAHPQFHSATWVPPGWAERVQQSSYPLPPRQSQRWNFLTEGPDR